MSKVTRNLKKQNGQGVMEYVIISSLVGIFCLVAMKQFGASVHKRVEKMRKEIVRTIPVN
ncbi:hypothetical protein A9Q84_09275 [Halobacteriovorax marinus]|uniref:Flp family type IVb pilin n=1 Tax=Halobacteriovorax marinus TaxID=97084 RepID=A0A1Y5FCG4_9BACT|nr:hypothetical protein A9Q84_09275 [Halobacteriovorax marinus]